MARDYRQLRVFEYADDLVLEIYRITRRFPKDEMYAMTNQMRRAATSIPANIVEGSQRRTEGDFLNFLHIAIGSAAELGYFLSLAHRLDYLPKTDFEALSEKHDKLIRSLQSLIRSLRRPSSPHR